VRGVFVVLLQLRRRRQFDDEVILAYTLLAAARECEADMIVIGTHGRSGTSRLVLGSTAESVVRHAACPVLVVKLHAQT
jgi:nucleotide-binding universal stress UspA family protein